jgi:hypothetical protein
VDVGIIRRFLEFNGSKKERWTVRRRFLRDSLAPSPVESAGPDAGQGHQFFTSVCTLQQGDASETERRKGTLSGALHPVPAGFQDVVKIRMLGAPS